ncbi:hypothetical protein H8B09_26550 [Paenibacillus sp. PR3]|uniref:Copper amine oxidase-like N-terminal domain-containing protein n=1 Tax=Paenibacillus terricola TaxID=2763503 RepID=A0ABR8N2F2_9BACL|nr:copper amine oxidase N-terminal domain-containing protein [Paenibacillus terricola]MBD3922344.1 hypothetical protein [Paenibacillus terricola]
MHNVSGSKIGRTKAWKRLLIMLSVFSIGLSIIGWGGHQRAYADSPLTSTDFYRAYEDIDAVEAAKKGGMTKETAAFLSSEEQPIDEKAAVINAIYAGGSEWKDRHYADDYAKLVFSKTLDALNPAELGGDDLFVLGYLNVMDHYLQVDNVAWLVKAKQALPSSLTVSLIYAVAFSQMEFDCSWEYVRQTLEDSNLQADLRPEAVDFITDYMKLYEGSPCSAEQAALLANNIETEELLASSVVLFIDQPTVLNHGVRAFALPGEPNVSPYATKGTTLVPLRFIADAFGAKVGYDPKKHTVTIQTASASFTFVPNEHRYVSNGKQIAMNGAMEVKQGRAYVPLRVIAEALGKHVYYNQGLIIISDNKAIDPSNKHDQELANAIRQRLLKGEPVGG